MKKKSKIPLYYCIVLPLICLIGILLAACNQNGEPIEENTGIDAEYDIADSQEAVLLEKLSKSIVKVFVYGYGDDNTPMAWGSGFFIKDDGTFITNGHVAEDAWAMKIESPLNPQEFIDVVGIYKYVNNESFDFAVCKAEYMPEGCESVVVSTDYKVKDTVFSVGFPDHSNVPLINKGEIIDTEYIEGYSRLIKSSAHVEPGNSGGIFSNDRGEVVGLVTRVFPGGTSAAQIPELIKNKQNDVYYESDLIPLNEFFYSLLVTEVTEENLSGFISVGLKRELITETEGQDVQIAFLENTWTFTPIRADTYYSYALHFELKIEINYTVGFDVTIPEGVIHSEKNFVSAQTATMVIRFVDGETPCTVTSYHEISIENDDAGYISPTTKYFKRIDFIDLQIGSVSGYVVSVVNAY
jgi:hypothetical protein